MPGAAPGAVPGAAAPGAASEATPAPGTAQPLSVRVIMVDFSGREQLAAFPTGAPA